MKAEIGAPSAPIIILILKIKSLAVMFLGAQGALGALTTSAARSGESAASAPSALERSLQVIEFDNECVWVHRVHSTLNSPARARRVTLMTIVNGVGGHLRVATRVPSRPGAAPARDFLFWLRFLSQLGWVF